MNHQEITTTPGGQRPANQNARNNYPTDNYPTSHYPTDQSQTDATKDSSRYSHPDQRPEKDGPGGA